LIIIWSLDISVDISVYISVFSLYDISRNRKID